MKIEFADTFKASFKKMMFQQTPLYKTYEYFRYDLPNFVRNIWIFKKELMNFHWWDYTGLLMFMKKSLDVMSVNHETRGVEWRTTKEKKVEKMRRAAELINNILEDNFVEQAENRLNKKRISSFLIDDDFNWQDIKLEKSQEDINRSIYELSVKIQDEQMDEFLNILRGPDMEKFKEFVKANPGDDQCWEKFYEGNGLVHWWD